MNIDLDAISANFRAIREKAGVPVIPIAVKTDCEPTRPDGKGWLKDFGTVDTSKEIRLRCGPPISGTAKEMHQKVFDWRNGGFPQRDDEQVSHLAKLAGASVSTQRI